MSLDETSKQQLVEAALHARQWAYAPYSHYAVGAALLTTSGKVYDGVNVENAAYPSGVCAERVAVYKAVSEGEREFLAIAVVTENAVAPCGFCRQVLAEFGVDTLVIITNGEGKVVREIILKDLLPGAFRSEDLPRVTP